jgi:rhamnosyl/mannosyltransferase
VDLERFALTPRVSAAARSIRERFASPLVLFVGRLVYYKGLQYLVEAMQHVEAQCLIIGQGPLQKNLAGLARTLGVAGRVRFLSACTDAELPAYYHACDVFVLPSCDLTEAFGLVQLEAMACGKPVVSTDLPSGVGFVNRDGETGLRVPARDSLRLAAAIHRLLADPNLRASLGHNAQRRAHEEFSIELMAKRYIEVYDSLLRSGQVSNES